MAKEKKRKRELTEEELKQVEGGNTSMFIKEYLVKLSCKKYNADGECIEND